MSVRLLTIDEAHATISRSACELLTLCHATDPFTAATMLWGAGSLDGLDEHDRRLTRHHRELLDTLIGLGYGGIAVDELEGVASAAGLDEGLFHPAGLDNS